MKVRELIEALKAKDPEADVVVPLDDDLDWEYDYALVQFVEDERNVKYVIDDKNPRQYREGPVVIIC